MIDLKKFLQLEINKFDLNDNVIEWKKIKNINTNIFVVSISNLEIYDYQVLINKIIQSDDVNMLKILENFLISNENINNFFTYEFSNTGSMYFLSFKIKKEICFKLLNDFYSAICNNHTQIYSAHSTHTDCADQFDFVEKIENVNVKNILFDYSSPNMAKDMHVGHLRSTIIGDVLANIYEYAGHTIKRINHLGDFGLPFGMILEYVIANKIEINEKTSLQQIYTAARNCFKYDELFQTNAYLRTKQLQSKSDKDVSQVWDQIYKHSLNSYNQTYQILKISPNLEICGESFYEKYIDQVKNELETKGLISIDDNKRTIVKTMSLNPMIYEKSEEKCNGYTYDTTDIVTLWYRTTILNQDEIYYVVDNGQSLHFKQLFEIGKLMNWTNNKHAEHIQFGIITLDKKRIASRDGNTPKLFDLIEKGTIYTQEYFNKKNNVLDPDSPSFCKTHIDIITSVTIGSIKYFDLVKSRTTDYQFDFKNMLRPDGNTFLYLTYTIARCRGIIEKLYGGDCVLPKLLCIEKLENSDFKLLRKICEFPTIINNILHTKMPHYLCDYLYKLASMFHETYSNSRSINFDENNKIINFNESRIVCYIMILEIFKKSFKLLGLPCVDKI